MGGRNRLEFFHGLVTPAEGRLRGNVWAVTIAYGLRLVSFRVENAFCGEKVSGKSWFRSAMKAASLQKSIAVWWDIHCGDDGLSAEIIA